MPTDPRDQLAVFLGDIKDNPADDTPRLILADWLQDQGDPRGELLALELQRLRLGDGHPKAEELYRRERQILNRHVYAWLGDFLDVASDWEFHRGFIHLSVRAERFLTDEIDALAGTEPFLWLEALRLQKLTLAHLRRLLVSPALDVITALDLSENNLGDDGLALLAACPRLGRLHTLTLQRTRPGERGLEALAASPHLTRLQRLDLRGNRLSPEAAGLLRGRFGDRLRIGRLPD